MRDRVEASQVTRPEPLCSGCKHPQRCRQQCQARGGKRCGRRLGPRFVSLCIDDPVVGSLGAWLQEG